LSVSDASITEWLEGQAVRRFEQQRATIDNSKLMATFIAAVAATIVATTLQVTPNGKLDFFATVGLVWCLFATWRVIEADRLKMADHQDIMTRGNTQHLKPEAILENLREGTIAAVNFNETVIDDVRAALWRVLIAAAAGSALALMSLLRPFLLGS
jgi:hypothetical protein